MLSKSSVDVFALPLNMNFYGKNPLRPIHFLIHFQLSYNLLFFPEITGENCHYVRISPLRGKRTPAAKMSPGETGRKTADRYTPLHTGGDTPRGSHREARPVCILWGCCWCYRDMFMELSIRRNREGMRVCVLGDRRREGGIQMSTSLRIVCCWSTVLQLKRQQKREKVCFFFAYFLRF